MAAMFLRIITLIVLCAGFTTGSISCKDPTGTDVDWYYVYKLPMIDDSPEPLISEGLGHYYLDVNDPTFKLSEASLNDTKQAVAQTLKPIYSQSAKLAYVMYNDEWPNGKTSETRGHTKGVVAFDDESGYWLVHSVPKFPDNTTYFWPENALHYGQSMLCVTFKTSSMEDIAHQMTYMYPSVYAHSLPDQLLSLAPSFGDVVNGRHVKTPPWNKRIPLNSAMQQQFLHYAKSNKYNEDIYSDFVAPDLETSLQTETWRNSPGHLPSNCTGEYHVLNVRNITFPAANFSSSKDHSKLAITDKTVGTVCVGDINRVQGQFTRGGGTLCTAISSVYQQYNSLVSALETC